MKKTQKLMKMSVIALLAILLFKPGNLTGKDSTNRWRGSLLYAEVGVQAGPLTTGCLGLSYIHPRNIGFRFTHRYFRFIPPNRPEDFYICRNGGFLGDLFLIEDPKEIAKYWELAFIKRMPTKLKWAFLTIEAGAHYSEFTSLRYWKTDPQAGCYKVDRIDHYLYGLNARVGLQMVFLRFIGVQVGFNGLFNEKKMVFGPELTLAIGILR